jgi:prepilin-type N-terminal cleavage/methylation domain-containing protein
MSRKIRTLGRDRQPLVRGFTLVELLVAMGIFLVVGTAAFSLFARQQPLFKMQQGQAATNIGLRNAVAQIQMDMVNAGTRYFVGVNIPASPVGVTIQNNVVATGNSCYNANAQQYTASCFDTLNIIAVNGSVLPINATDSSGGTLGSNCSDTSTGTAYGRAAPSLSVAQTAAQYFAGDQVLFLTGSGLVLTTAVLTANATAGAHGVVFTFNPTTGPSPGPAGMNTAAYDPLAISTHALTTTVQTPWGTKNSVTLGNQFCGSDWILKLAPITYSVDITTNPNDPALVRQVKGASPTIVMDQIVGFKVGASIWNNTTNSTNVQYYYDASQYPVPYDFSAIRSVRASIIGRTPPSADPNYPFRNSFDHGPYQILGASVVVNPRNLSMND